MSWRALENDLCQLQLFSAILYIFIQMSVHLPINFLVHQCELHLNPVHFRNFSSMQIITCHSLRGVAFSGMRIMSHLNSDFNVTSFVDLLRKWLPGYLVKNSFDHPALGVSGQSMASYFMCALGSIIHQTDGGKHERRHRMAHETSSEIMFT